MNTTWPDIVGDGVALVDGGTGTELRRRGFPVHAHVWSAAAAVTHAELLTHIHTDYIDAGADVVTANTFATCRFVLEAVGLDDGFERINHASLDAAFRARDAAGRPVAVAASLSCLPPRFDVRAYPSAAAEQAAYAELAALFAARGVDLILLEMMQDAEHATLACEAVRAAGLPWWLGVSCRLDGARLVAFDAPGVEIAPTLEVAAAHGPAAITVMHSTPAATGPALALVAARWSGPFGAYPESNEDTTRLTPAGLAALAADWIDAGARIVGGCCGTGPEHIRALRALIDSRAS